MWLKLVPITLILGPVAALIATYVVSGWIGSTFFKVLLGQRLLFFGLSLVPFFIVLAAVSADAEPLGIWRFVALIVSMVAWAIAQICFVLYSDERNYVYRW